MKLQNKIASVLATVLFTWPLLSLTAQAVTPTSLSLSATTGDAVQINITGAANGNILISFLPPGASSMTTAAFGTTDGGGNFATTISSGGYGIPAGSPVYASINGLPSVTTLWPNYTSALTLSQGSAQIAIGQTLNINASSGLILAANSLPGSISAAINGSSVAITGLASGSGSLALCGANVGCSLVSVAVGGQAGQTQITFSNNNIVLNGKQTQGITVFGGSSNGYTVNSNSNPAVLDATIAGRGSVITLYGKETAGTAAVVVCSVDSASNCATLNTTVLNNSVSTLSFSQNNLTLTPGLVQTAIVSGGVDNNYYIYSNSNSGAVGASLSGTTVTVTGGGNAGSAVIRVCSITVSSSCGDLNITTNLNNAAPSATVLAFSQNVVSVNAGDTTSVTVSGGVGSSYVITANSNPTAVTASINASSNIINLAGNAVGSAIIGVCSSSANTTCANLAVTVKAALLPIYFSQNNVALTTGQSLTISITGGNDASKVISTNSNAAVASASIASGGSLITVTGGTATGSTAITICSSSTAYNNNCATLNITNTAVPAAPTIAEVLAINTIIPIRNPNYTFSSNKAGTIVYGGDCSSSTTAASAGNNTVQFNTLATGLHNNCTVKVVDAKGNTSNQINVSAFTIKTSDSGTATPPSTVLGSNSYKFTRTLNLGDKGAEVSELQKVLKKLGYFTYPTITGLFGSVTKQAVVAFQKAKNLKPYPGWVGPGTRTALNNL